MHQKIKHGDIFPNYELLLPKDLQLKLSFLKSFFKPYTSRVYLVGGAVRDMVRKRFCREDVEIFDVDLEVFGIDKYLFKELMDRLGTKGVGKSFFVYKYQENIDISLPRVEYKISRGHKGFSVKIATDEKIASIRRDFKMNALMLNIFSSKIFDFWGGLEDIFKKQISIIDEKKFKEDSLRVLRGIQFSARFGYKIEKRSCTVLKSINLDDLSKQRVFWEFEKLFMAKNLHFGLYYLVVLDIFKKIFRLKIDRKFFLKTAFELAKNRKNFEKEIYKFYFLYIVSKNLHKNFIYFLDILETPNEYFRVFKKQKFLPKNITDRFLVALSMLYPLKYWLGNYKRGVKTRAIKLGFWDRSFDGGIYPKNLLKEGFYGKELGIELRRRRLKIIKENYKGRDEKL